jgi:hypothetical protein
VPLAR